MACVHFDWAQIFTQVNASFSPFGHPTQVDASWSQYCFPLYGRTCKAALKWLSCYSRWTCVYVYSRVRLATHRKSAYASSHFLTCVALCLRLAGPVYLTFTLSNFVKTTEEFWALELVNDNTKRSMWEVWKCFQIFNSFFFCNVIATCSYKKIPHAFENICSHKTLIQLWLKHHILWVTLQKIMVNRIIYNHNRLQRLTKCLPRDKMVSAWLCGYLKKIPFYAQLYVVCLTRVGKGLWCYT